MVAERSITVKLKLDKSDFTNGLKEAALEAKAFQKELEGIGVAGGRSKKGLDDTAGASDNVGDSFETTGQNARDLSDELGRLTGSTDAQSMADLALARSQGEVSKALADRDRALRDLAKAQNEASKEGANQVETQLAVEAAQTRVEQSTVRLGDARSKLAAESIGLALAENKLAKAENDHERALLRLAAAEKRHDDQGTDESAAALEAARIRAEKLEIDRVAAAHRLDAEMESFNKRARETEAGLDRLGGSFDDAGRNNDNFGKGISASNGRMALLVQYGIALGPALVPTLAAAVPLAAALGTGLAFAAVGAGTAVLAFQGVGKALKAMNDFAVDPTEAHLKALKIQMDALGPAGQEFVVFLQQMRPELQKLQNIAQAGLFPGLEEGITSVLTQMPLIEGVVESVSTAMGDLAASAGEALTSPFWTEFFTYIRDDATQIITDFSVGFGKLGEGLAALLLDFAPLTSDIAAGFADMGRSFSEWAQGLPQTKGFQEFIQYLRDTGPQVLDTLANLGKALLDLGVALSGLPAQESLLILNTLAKVISGIASSPVGPGLLAVAVGLAAITRAIGLFDTIQASAVMQFLGGKRGGGTGPVSKVGGVLGGLVSQKGAIIGAIGLIGLSLTDLDEKLGLTGVLSGAAVGSVFGPYGAVLGATAGYVKELADANNDLTDSMDALNKVAKETPLDFEARKRVYQGLIGDAQELNDKAAGLAVAGGTGAVGIGILGKVADHFRDQADAGSEGAASFATKTLALQQGVLEFQRAVTGDPLGSFNTGLANVEDTAGTLVPRLQAVGYSTEQIVTLLTTHEGWDAAVEKVKKYDNSLGTVEGKSKAVGAAIAALGGSSLDSAADVDALATAMDNLFSPAIAYSQALDDWRQGLADLNDEIKGTSINQFTEQGRANRDAIRQQATDLVNLVTLDLKEHPNKGPAAVAQQLLDLRKQLIDTLHEIGVKGPELQRFLSSLHLDQKGIKFVFDGAGIDLAKAQAKELVKDFEKIPKKIRTKVEADGISADATVKSLMRKYEGLTRFDATTILKARDMASPVANNVLSTLKSVARTFTANVKVNADTSALSLVQQQLASLHDKTITVNVNTGAIGHIAAGGMFHGTPSGLVQSFAGGGFPSIGSQQPQVQRNHGPGGIRWAETGAGPWEAFISGHPMKRERSKDIATDVVNRLGGVAHFADGGRVGRNISAGDIGQRSVRPGLSFMRDLERALARFRHEAKETEHQEDRVTAARHRSRDATHQLNEISKKLDAAESKDKVNRKEVYRLKQLEIAQREREKDAIKKQTYEEKQLSKQEAELAKARDKWKLQQQQLLSQAQAISSVIREQGAIFGGQGTSTTVGGILAKLRTSAADAQKFRHYIAKLRAAGLDERIIQQLLEQGPTPEGLATAKNLAQASDQQLNRINRQERQLVGVAASTGALGIRRHSDGDVNVKVEIHKVETSDVRALRREMTGYTRKAVRLARAKA